MESRDEFLKLLSGSGIEIGALHRPCDAPHLKVTYVDRLTSSQALEHYPELKSYKLVEPEIIDDAETLASVPSNSQNFVIANHVIEHMANPLLAISNWLRVLNPGGRLFLAVPDKNQTFDKNRQITSLEHIISDFEAPDADRDFEHFKEFALEVSCKTFNVRPVESHLEFAKELWDKQYSIHYHVWDFPNFFDFIQYALEVNPSTRAHVLETRPTVGDEFIFVLERSS